ncbi:riboflavin kinase [Piedraia hortae CBS 480.64]|uniref:Riboflavin kinase n=1 Tax=Piedraia hortae CBS 480.64 TaxID=1314780 RepID=A0A6A7C456_9PEZI|nr:riboflavin kinase [Piedraia hortae CBS 480.64]
MTANERPKTSGPASGPESPFPIRLSGKVVNGFGRGSKELGVPTANIPLSGLSVGGHENIQSGVFFGWAGLTPCQATKQSPPESVGKYQLMSADVSKALYKAIQDEKGTGQSSGAVYPMVMSIGWNPFYKNEVRSVEVHIMHDFETDFYGEHMNLCILAFIRPELDYVSKEKLIEDIRTDIDVAGRSLARSAYLRFRKDEYLVEFRDKADVAD